MLFEPLTINGKLTLKNRVVMPPAVTRLATEDGDITQELIDRYMLYCKGGSALVLMEAVSVERQKSGQLLRLNEDRYIDGFKKLAQQVHAETDAKIAPQILHFMKIARSGYRQKIEDLEYDYVKAMPKLWGDAAYRAREAGMDAVELHFAHAYTLASSLSRYNKRKDEYGGAKIDNRMRLMSEIIQAARAAVGDDYCLGCRINGDEFTLGGNTLVHSRQIALRCVELGLDYVSVSAGGKFEDAVPKEGESLDPYTGYSGTRTMPPAWMPERVNMYLAADIKKTLVDAGYTNIPVIGAGRIPTPEVAEDILQKGDVDLIGLCRPVLCDPYWPNKYKEGRGKDVLKCTYCNSCREMEGGFTTVECIQWKKKGQPQP